MDQQTFNNQESSDLYQDNFDNIAPYIHPDESISQIYSSVQGIVDDDDTATLSNVSVKSTVWEYFDRSPPYAQEYNVCKICAAKYKTTTGVSTLRNHLKKHQLDAPSMKQKAATTRMNPFGELEQKEHTKYLIQWLVCDLQPFTVVDNSYFRAFISHFCPRYTIPERHQVKDYIIDKFNNQRIKIINELHKIEGRYSLTADMWTSINKEAFLGLTLHYVDSNWCLCNFLLDIIPFTDRHTGVNIAQEILRVLNEFQISDKVIALTTDNESAMLVCGREIASALDTELSLKTFSHYRCVAHVLNLGVKQGLELVSNSVEKVRELMIKIKDSTRLCDELHGLCDLKKINYLKPILDVKTHWNSTYYMLKRLEQLQPALVLLSADNQSINDLYPSGNDWKTIKDTLKVLEPLEKATVHLSASSYPTIGDVRFIFGGIQKHLYECSGIETFTQREVAASILQKIIEYWDIMDCSTITSAILDPRTKLTFFSEESKQNACAHIQSVFETYQQHSSITSTMRRISTSSINDTRQYFARLQHGGMTQISSMSTVSELDRYLALPVDVDTDPLLWWQAHAREYPTLSDMARDYLTIQATSVSSEQAFSVAGNTISKTRNRLLPETARACLCLKSWTTKKIVD